MSDDDDTPILPASIELHLCLDGTVTDKIEHATLGSLTMSFTPNEMLRQHLECDETLAHHAAVGQQIADACFTLCSKLNGTDSQKDATQNSQAHFEIDDVIRFGNNGDPESWSYGIYAGEDDKCIKYTGIDTAMGRYFTGYFPLALYVVREVPVPYSGLDGLVYAETLFVTHNEVFYRNAFELIQEEDVLKNIVLDTKHVNNAAAIFAVKYMRTRLLLESVKRKAKIRGEAFVAACNEQIQKIR